jgi:hypothetical protein
MTETPTAEPPPLATEETPKEIEVEFHKPKPFHNWREFLKEYAIIVLGVCTALAGETALEELRWHNRVQEARGVIASEIAYNLDGAIWRVRTLTCVEQRLDTLGKILDETSRSGSLPPIGYIDQPPRHMWRSGNWDSVVASQTATHFPPGQLAQLGAIYKVVQRLEDHAIPESQAWSDLYAMVGPGRRLDPASEAGLRSALGRARNDGRTIATLAVFLVNQAQALDLPFSKSEREQIDRARTQPLSQQTKGLENPPVSPSAICEPIGAAPASYGAAPTKEATAAVGAVAKSLPDFGAP